MFTYGANPTIASYNASVVNSPNGTGSLARFKNKNIIFYFALAYYNAGVVAVNSKIVGLASYVFVLITNVLIIVI
jgi:hypothetical protein